MTEHELNALRWKKCDIFIEGEYAGIGLLHRWSASCYEIMWDHVWNGVAWFGLEDVTRIHQAEMAMPSIHLSSVERRPDKWKDERYVG